MSEFPLHLTIEWLKEHYQKGLTTPIEVINEIIARSNRDKAMNIWITPPNLDVIKPYLDRLESLDPSDTPLWGIPFAIKDNIDLKDVPTTAGCEEFTYIPKVHASVVELLVHAGAIPIGKTNMDQFATGLVGTRSPYGETHNAIRGDLISGGSSSGSAVAVAKGQAAFALGTDTAGSGRVPAALNNLIGFKPSLGAWSKKGVVPACESIDSVSVFAHGLGDALLVDQQLRFKDPTDPWSKEFPGPYASRPKKICLPKNPLKFYGSYEEDYKEAWRKAVDRIKELDIPIEYVDIHLFTKAAEILYSGPWIAERWAALGEFVDSHPHATHPVTEKVLRSGASDRYDAASLFHAMHKLQVLKREAEDLLSNNVLIMPTCGGTWTREQVRRDPVATNSHMGEYTNHCNLLDMAAIAVPGREATQKIPFGITLFSLSDQEGLMIEVADRLLKQSKNETNRNPVARLEEEMTYFVVCGLHMRGYPLEKQMIESGATFIKEETTSPSYQLVKLSGYPSKPGLIKKTDSGASIEVEIWKMPLKSLGKFTTSIPAPLGIGKVELQDGRELPGFICEGYAEHLAEDISQFGGWKNLQPLI
ncbi:allophanate hydrolase [Oceanobacillus iheyensis]|uniref:allophanate hydrolase n=1 Tax=Oceanobacillus iheyensis TaxID=182710 RepID=UPI00362987C9